MLFFCFSCRVILLPGIFTKAVFSACLDNCKGTNKSRNYHSSDICHIQPISISKSYYYYCYYFFIIINACRKKARSEFCCLLTLSLMFMQNCQLQSIRTNSIEPQTISSMAYHIMIVFIISVKSVIILMKG